MRNRCVEVQHHGASGHDDTICGSARAYVDGGEKKPDLLAGINEECRCGKHTDTGKYGCHVAANLPEKEIRIKNTCPVMTKKGKKCSAMATMTKQICGTERSRSTTGRKEPDWLSEECLCGYHSETGDFGCHLKSDIDTETFEMAPLAPEPAKPAKPSKPAEAPCSIKMTRKHTKSANTVNFYYVPQKAITGCEASQICAVGLHQTDVLEVDFGDSKATLDGACIGFSTAEKLCAEDRVVMASLLSENGAKMCTQEGTAVKVTNLPKGKGLQTKILPAEDYSASVIVNEGGTKTRYNYYLPGSAKFAEWADKPFLQT
mmetsp:Transcript_24475/g.60469  ORF Transcript_24475/g.60469 Transcript_24475/m.60469 type:complete len:317 (-) Transcript_24475:351-1301(-)